MRPKILVIVGTRPEAIKLAPVVLALRRRSELETMLVTTGQHRDLVGPALHFFDLAPDRDLGLMRANQGPGDATARTLGALDALLDELRPGLAIAEGDTSTVLATALACFYRDVPFAHVEAGLRSGEDRAPFPEEMHRVLAGRLASLHFAPTEHAAQHLRDEGVDPDRVFVTGNPVVDAIRAALERLDPAPEPTDARPTILVTAHRRESFGAPLAAICRAIRELATARELRIVFPVHPNPSVRRTVASELHDVAGLELTAPLDYPQLVDVLRSATLVLTDSGGLQEEAPVVDVPVLVLRDRTERTEGIDAGNAILVGTDSTRIVAETLRLLDDEPARLAMARAPHPFGDGFAAERIAAEVDRWLSRAGSSR